MNAATAMLTVGTRLRHDGETYTVVRLDGSRITLRSGRGSLTQVAVGFLLGHPTTRIAGADDPPVEALGAALSDLTKAQAEVVRHGWPMSAKSSPATGAAVLRWRPQASHGPSTTPYCRSWPATRRRPMRWALGSGASGAGSRASRSSDRQAWWTVAATADSTPSEESISAGWTCARPCSTSTSKPAAPTRDLLLQRVEARVEQAHGKDVVPLPGRKRGRQVLAELSRGTNAFVGSTKGKRSIADRPEGPYGRLRPTRPGEYLLLDTTTLDVFAMESVTLRWVRLELTIALDLLTRCIVGLRLSPVSTKAVDAALVLYEAINPNTSTLTGSTPRDGPRQLRRGDARHLRAEPT